MIYMNATSWDSKLRAALAGDDKHEIWSVYKNVWDLGRTPDMNGQVFAQLFTDASVANEAVRVMNQSSEARDSISSGAKDVDPDSLSDRRKKG